MTPLSAPVAVTRWAVHVPGPDAGPDVVPPESASDLLGRKGLLAKEPATRLALCAVHRALGRPRKAPRPDGPPDPATAVVVASNLGNVATVADVARTVRDGSWRQVSPLQAPNASSNVIASTVAIWFRFGGPNLTVCSGATAGLDAVAVARLLLAAGRADRVLAVGVEPADDTAALVHRGRTAAAGQLPLRAGAACVVLERTNPATAVVVGDVHTATPSDDPADPTGDLYGAAGVVRLARAATLLARGLVPGPVTVSCGDEVDGWCSVRVSLAATTGRDVGATGAG